MMPTFTGFGPRPTGRVREIAIAGAFLAWEEDGPVLLRMPGSGSWYLAIFPTILALCTLYAKLEKSFTRIQTIDDPDEFLASFADSTDVIVIFDPRFTPEGRVHFTQIPTGPQD